MTMEGVAEAKRLVNDYLKSDIPTRLVTYRNAWNLDDQSLPDPLRYFTYEPLAMDRWPTIITVAISTQELTRQDYDGGGNPEYRVRYNMRTYLWVRSDSNELVTEMRDRLTTVLRSAILDHPALQTCSETAGTFAMIEESSVREEYSDITLVKGERALAGSYIAYDLYLDEYVTRKQTGTVNSFDVDAYNIGITEDFE